MSELSLQQQDAVYDEHSVFVTACPGSGKTRVLTAKVVYEVKQIQSTKHQIIAVTYTNRAADEITSRLHESGLSSSQAWTGTIHGFALEWILRPYACYLPELDRGFTVADDFYTRCSIDALKAKHGLRRFDDVPTGYTKEGGFLTESDQKQRLIEEYRKSLLQKKLIDFDMVLYFAYRTLQDRPEISKTLAAIIKLICVDEYQDTQELQYGILSAIVRSSGGETRVFIVGDEDQAIYSSLGSVAKALPEIKEEFGLLTLNHHTLSGNYRSTQRIIDFCSQFQNAKGKIISRAEYANEPGIVTFSNQEVHLDDLVDRIATLIRFHLEAGVPPHEICVLAPQWTHVTNMGRQLLSGMPEIELDAPGLSPFRTQKDSVWFKLTKILLTDPHPNRYWARIRLAKDFVQTLETELGYELCAEVRSPRKFLKLCNSIYSEETQGIDYLDNIIQKLLVLLEIDVSNHEQVQISYDSFFRGARDRLEQSDYSNEIDVDSLKKMFRHPAGVVLNTCHGVKGQEYTTVIAFGMLRGYVPNWRCIMNHDADEREESRRLLYVVSSRARKHLYLLAENGRQTKKKAPYETTAEIAEIAFPYDELIV